MNNTTDLVFCPSNDHSSQLFPTFSPSPFFNDILSKPIYAGDYHPLHLDDRDDDDDDHHHHQILDSSSTPQFEFDPDSLYAVFLHPNNDHDEKDNRRHHHHHHHQTSLDLLPLNNTAEDHSVDASELNSHMEDSKEISNPRVPAQASKRRTSKTDRHSKIYTAKGPRDRRMRLSLQVAREFFGLQDMLGFDKASKTVNWLLTQAQPEIEKLASSRPHRFTNGLSSEESQTRWADLGEVASSLIGEEGNHMNEVASAATTEKDEKSGKEKKKRSQSRNPIFRKLPKDARAKARERAKERTKEKLMMKERSSSDAVVHHIKKSEVSCHLGTNSNRSSFQTGEDPVQETEEPQFVGCNNMGMSQEEDVAQESLDIINRWSPFSIFSYHQNHGPAASMAYQITDHHQFLGKPRNAFYNPQNMC